MSKRNIRITDLSQRHLILKFFAQKGRINPLEEDCEFTLDSVNFITKGIKKVYEPLELPLNGKFSLEYEDLLIELEIREDETRRQYQQNSYGNFGVSSDTLIVYSNFTLRFNNELSVRVLEIIKNCVNDEEKNETSNLQIYYNRGHDIWCHHSDIPSERVQSTSNIFLPDDLMSSIIRDIDAFMDLKIQYDEIGFTHKKTFLLKGKPGMGKSSIAKSIAHRYKRRLYMLNLGNKTMNEDDLIELFRKIKENSVLVLEDIDAFFTGRKSGSECTTGISFSTLLNLLDGNLSTGNGLLVFITANNAEYLDHALIRKGRIDRIINFGDMTRDQFDAAFRARVKSEEPDEELFRICNRHSISMSGLMYVLFFAKTPEERRTMAREIASERSFTDVSHMYS